MTYRRSSFSSAVNCLEADTDWHKAAVSNPSGNCVTIQWERGRCSTNSCVEVSHKHDEGGCPWVHVRDTKQGDRGPVLVWKRTEWADGRILDFIPVSSRKADDALKQVAL